MSTSRSTKIIYIALLRGINVGGNNKVEMKKLKATSESLGFTDVSTYINSGNVIFTSEITDIKALQEQIEKAIEKDFGFYIKVVVKTFKNIEKVATKIPNDWQNDKEQKTDVIFLWEQFDSPKTLDLLNAKPDVDSLIYVDGAIIWHIDRENYSKSAMNKFIGTEVYKNMTARNVNTVRNLLKLMESIG